ncbi:MAG: YceI family protein [Bacteroidota bacterium]|nr:YceI family protein [Bacteroidota bacterium]
MMKRIGLLIVILLVAVMVSFAQAKYEVRSFQMMISGTSNLHDWTSQVKKLSGEILVDFNDGNLEGIRQTNIRIDALSLKSSKGGIMDHKMYGALNAKTYPEISFILTKTTSIRQASGNYYVSGIGNLSIAGVTMPVDLEIKGRVLPNGDVEISGEKKLKMSTFKITPPTALLGTLKTHDDITVSYTIIVKSR